MRILIFLLILPALLPAQKEITTDSTWITNAGGLFYENHITRYSTGEEEGGYKRLLGDTAQVLSKYTTRIEQQAELLSNDARVVMEFPAKIKQLIRLDGAITALLGSSPVDSLRRKYAASLVDSSWTIRSGGQARDIVFSVNAQGVLRYKIDTLPTRSAVILGGVLRLNNYLGSTDDVPLYKVRDGFYATIDKGIVLKPAGAAQANRTIIDPVIPSPAPDTTIKQLPKTKKNKKFKG